MNTDVTLEGFKELEKALKALPAVVSKRLLNTATRSGAMVIRREAKKNAPFLTGRLLKSIGVRRKRGRRSPTLSQYQIGWLSDGFYGRFIELGTRYHAPRPHLRPALDNNKREAIEKIREILWRGIKREAKKHLK